MKILLFGGSGQLGHEIINAGRDLNFEIISPISSEVDITDTDQVAFLLKKIEPALVINAAAYTAVDKAEEEQELAFEINGHAITRLTNILKDSSVRLIHLSTDYVFDGTASTPYKESDSCNPLSVYGASKLVAEESIKETLGEKALIVRTSGLHGRAGNNIVHTLLKLFEERDELAFVSDQVTSTTWTTWLAEVLLDLARIDAGGVVHACCGGAISWHEFACEVWRQANTARPFERDVRINPVKASEFPRPATRPAYSVMDTSRLSELIGRDALWWEEGVAGHLRQINYRHPR